MPGPSEQYQNKDSFDLLDTCCRLIAEKFGNPEIAGWANGDYIRLSSILSRQTDIQLSPSTLKRIFGKLKTTDRYYPQRATRDALAVYAGYKNWDDFAAAQPAIQDKSSEPVVTAVADHPVVLTPDRATTARKKWLQWMIVLVCMGIVALVYLLYRKGDNTSVANANHYAQLVCQNPEGENPHSARFIVSLPKRHPEAADSFLINFGDGEPQQKVAAGQLISHYYEVPGRYYARLLYRGQAIDTVPVFLKTQGWTATARMERDTTRVYPVEESKITDGLSLSVDAATLFYSGIDTNHTFYVDFVNTSPWGIDGDNFELTAHVKTSMPRAGVRCSQVYTCLFGKRSYHSFMIMKPGCEKWIAIQLSDWQQAGEFADLRALTADLSKGAVIKLRVQQKKAALFINDKKIYQAVYRQPLGQLFGLNISFSGIGAVYNAGIKDLATGQVRQLFPAAR